MVKKIIAWFKIPKGDYCYKFLRIENEKRITKRCPYQKICWLEDDHIVYCAYLDTFSTDKNSFDALLWDSCKICGLKEGN
jgi:hypothetical protein